MKCRCCNEELSECVQPALLPTQQPIPLVTCHNETCDMRGYTLAKNTYAALDLSPYLCDKVGAA